MKKELRVTTKWNFPDAYTLLFMSIFIIAIGIQLSLVLSHSFPINDGGLFFTMINDLQKNGYRLPWFTSYNSADIPFAYPPLPFYVAAIINSIFGVSIFDILRFLPVLIYLVTIPVFYFLSQQILLSKGLALLALIAYIFIPTSFRWLIMGGGLTRSIGTLFGLSSLYFGYRFYSKINIKDALLTILFCGLTVLSHPEVSYFIAYSLAIFYLMINHTWKGLLYSILTACCVFILISPWLVTVIHRHGQVIMNPFIDNGFQLSTGLVRLFLLRLSAEPLSQFWTFFGLVGLVICLLRKNFLLPCWFLVVYIIQPRAPDQRAIIPLAMMIAIGISSLVIFFKGLTPDKTWWKLISYTSIAFVVLYCTFQLFLIPTNLSSSLSNGERMAMEWLRKNTPTTSEIIVVSNDRWFEDKSAEWLPVLSERSCLSVVQGYEWFGNFSRRVIQHENLRECTFRGVNCLENWRAEFNQEFTHLYIPKPCLDSEELFDKCDGLRASLKQDIRYLLVYDGEGATIFERVTR